jgi:hypothetical protein
LQDDEPKSERDKVISKIRKLLALATSSNEHEAKLAADRASELLLRHNLTMQEIPSEEREYVHTGLSAARRLTSEDKHIMPLLREHFFVRPIFQRIKVQRQGKFSAWILVGERTNVEVAQYVYGFLVRKYPELWRVYQEAWRVPLRARQSYYLGLSEGISEQLSKTRMAVQTERGLVVVEDPKVLAHAEEVLGPMQNKRMATALEDTQALAAGLEDGRSVRISRGLEDRAENQGLALEDQRA